MQETQRKLTSVEFQREFAVSCVKIYPEEKKILLP